MEDKKVEGEQEGTKPESTEETITVPKKEYDSINQTLGSLKREIKDLKKSKEPSEELPPTQDTKSSSDLGEKAFLAVNGIKSADEVEFFQKMKKETGKDAESLLGSAYFQVEFKDYKEKKASSDATPTGSKRTNNASNTTVEYWLAKGELPPASEVQLRRDVVNARIKKESSSKGGFYNS